MPDRKDFALGDYVQVKDRIVKFYELFAGGRLVTDEVRATTEPDGKARIWVKALAYRTVDDPHPGVGWSWLEVPGNTPYTKGSELENAETSAWGRAIGSLGILIDLSIASANEVQNKAEPAKPRRAAAAEPPPPSDDALARLRGEAEAIFNEPTPEPATDAPLCPHGHGPMTTSRYGGWWCKVGYGTPDACREKVKP